ncbi:MAG: hypothetical protein HY744_34745 [Deltaproteobacteria bacterium]|nr:hypothetical protein [Deltaproteobacteria bacterium]
MKRTYRLQVARALAAVAAIALLGGAPPAAAQDEPSGDEPPPDEPPPDEPPPYTPRSFGAPPPVSGGSGEMPVDWTGAIQLLRVTGAAAGAAEAKAATEIFPDATKVWMQVYGMDPRQIEAARRGARKWICSSGCALGQGAPAPVGDAMLRSIKAQTPTQPLPLTIWRPIRKGGSQDTPSGATTTGRLMFDPVLLGRRSYKHVCTYGPVEKPAAPGEAVPPPLCRQREGKPEVPTPDSAELSLGMQWPRSSEMADFQYLAIVDSCGNARVQPFQREFSVPVYEVASGGCGRADGTVLRVFPSGTWIRITAFNLDQPAAGNVVSATFRVTVPALEDLVSADTPPILFPDPSPSELVVDCGPRVLRAAPGPADIPRPAPAKEPAKAPPGKEAAAGKAVPGTASPPPPRITRIIPESTPAGQPLAHQGLIIAPEPLLRGNCRIELRGQIKRRLVAPLALRVRLTRTDSPTQPVLVDEPWIVTPTDSVYRLKPLGEGFDGESRLQLEIYSDPRSADGNVILLSDAGRLARLENASAVPDEKLQRLIGAVTIYSAPLCGESNFETVEAAGSCLRGYFTVPAMLATLQLTRAPWVERPLITRKILSAVGVAFAIDSYDPVEREAFPIALQLGGFVQDLGEERIGLLGYAGIAPTLPVLGKGGNTTSIGVLAGAGVEYISNTNGPDEGLKPAAFLSIVVQVGQANPAETATGKTSFGTYEGD